MKTIGALLLSLLLTLASATITSIGDERALYGAEGPLEQNYLPREVAGWPAPFLADSPETSVIHKVGIEDDFRPGPFLASLSFWLLIVITLARLMRRSGRRPPTAR